MRSSSYETDPQEVWGRSLQSDKMAGRSEGGVGRAHRPMEVLWEEPPECGLGRKSTQAQSVLALAHPRDVLWEELAA